MNITETDTQPRIETMTVNDVVILFRSLGIQTSPTTIGDGIEQNKYPFGICIYNKQKQARRFEIYKKLVDEWVAQRVVHGAE